MYITFNMLTEEIHVVRIPQGKTTTVYAVRLDIDKDYSVEKNAQNIYDALMQHEDDFKYFGKNSLKKVISYIYYNILLSDKWSDVNKEYKKEHHITKAYAIFDKFIKIDSSKFRTLQDIMEI